MNVYPAPAGATAAPLRYFSPEIQQAYARARQDQDADAVDAVVFAVLLDHLPDRNRGAAVSGNEAATLGDDLGLDSVATVEMVFLLEDLFAIHITHAEIARVRTVGDLHAFVRRKLAGGA